LSSPDLEDDAQALRAVVAFVKKHEETVDRRGGPALDSGDQITANARLLQVST
jgi:hypothetical protein